MDKVLNTKNLVSYLLLLLIGLSIGFIMGSYTKPEEKSEVAQINYDSVCLRTLKEFYIAQDQEKKKQILKEASKKIAIDKMMNN